MHILVQGQTENGTVLAFRVAYACMCRSYKMEQKQRTLKVYVYKLRLRNYVHFMRFTFSRLVCGDVSGNFTKIFDRVQKVNSAHGPFTALLCVGKFFGDSNNKELDPYIRGEKEGRPIMTLLDSIV